MKSPALNPKKLLLRPSATLLHAMGVIDRAGTELALVANGKGEVIGTLSDGDIRRAILRGIPCMTPPSAMQ